MIQLTPRDRLILRQINNLTLTTRLVREVCRVHQAPFVSDLRLYQRLQQLERSGYIKKYPMHWNRENTFYLTKSGAEYLVSEGIEVFPRATKAIKPAIQQHEYELSRFWIKWMESCHHLNLPVVGFYRDGAFKAKVDKNTYYQPDGVILLKIRGKVWAFVLEMDRSTQSATSAFRTKLEHLYIFSRQFRRNPIFKQYGVSAMRIMIVCKSPQRARSLRAIAQAIGFNHNCAFTEMSQFFVITNPNTAKGWHYKKTNLLSAPIFLSCGRDPPCSILS